MTGYNVAEYYESGRSTRLKRFGDCLCAIEYADKRVEKRPLKIVVVTDDDGRCVYNVATDDFNGLFPDVVN